MNGLGAELAWLGPMLVLAPAWPLALLAAPASARPAVVKVKVRVEGEVIELALERLEHRLPAGVVHDVVEALAEELARQALVGQRQNTCSSLSKRDISGGIP